MMTHWRRRATDVNDDVLVAMAARRWRWKVMSSVEGGGYSGGGGGGDDMVG